MNRLRKMIHLRKKRLEYHEDFLQGLLVGDGKDPLTDEQIMDNILTLIIAGVFRSHPFFFYFLS